MGVRRRIVTATAGLAWLGVVIAAAAAPPRLFHVLLVFAASVTVPMLTARLVGEQLPAAVVQAARGHVNAYMLALNDCGLGHDPEPDEAPAPADDEPPARLHSV